MFSVYCEDFTEPVRRLRILITIEHELLAAGRRIEKHTAWQITPPGEIAVVGKH
jgi:hypothetical protein